MKFSPILLLLLCTFLIYFPSFFNPFIWDDEQFIYKNVYVQTFNIQKIFTTNTVDGAGNLSNYYRPLTTLSFAVDFQIWGLRPFGFHLTNTLLHIFAGWLVWKVLKNWKVSLWPRLFITSLFLLSPLQTEAVTYINSRGDSLYSVFGLLSILMMQKALAHPRSHTIYDLTITLGKWQCAALSSSFYALSILSKEIGIAVGGLLALVLLHHGWQHWIARRTISSMISSHVPALTSLGISAIVACGYIALRATALNFQNSFDFYEDDSEYSQHLGIRLLTFSKIIFIYIRLILSPYPLHMERTTEHVTSLGSPWPWLLLTAGVALVFLIRREARSHKTIFSLLGFGWMMTMLLPVSGIIPINGLLYEHWLYLPIVGFGLIIYGIAKLLPHSVKALVRQRKFILIILFTLFSAFLTLRQNYIWGDHIRFFNHVLQFHQTARVHNNLAMAYADSKDYDMAILHYQKGLELLEAPQIHHNIGNLQQAQGNTEAAIESYQKALKISPAFSHSITALIALYLDAQQYDRALEVLRESQNHNPTDVTLHVTEVVVLNEIGEAEAMNAKIDWIRTHFSTDREVNQFLDQF